MLANRLELKNTEIVHWRTRGEEPSAAVARAEAARVAKRIHATDTDLGENHAHLEEFVAASPAAGLLDWTGVGPVTAAKALVVWSHPDALRTRPPSQRSPGSIRSLLPPGTRFGIALTDAVTGNPIVGSTSSRWCDWSMTGRPEPMWKSAAQKVKQTARSEGCSNATSPEASTELNAAALTSAGS